MNQANLKGSFWNYKADEAWSWPKKTGAFLILKQAGHESYVSKGELW